jgi:hypothetical protein
VTIATRYRAARFFGEKVSVINSRERDAASVVLRQHR